MKEYELFDKEPLHIIISESFPKEYYKKRLNEIKTYLRNDLEYIIIETEPDLFALAIPLNMELNVKTLREAFISVEM